MSTDLHDDLSERAVLGSMLASPDTIADVADIVTADDFYLPAHATVYTAIISAHAHGNPTGPVAIAQHLATTGDLQRIGGAPYLHDLLATVDVAASAGFYARHVAGLAQRRRIATAAIRIHQRSSDLTTDTATMINDVQADLHAATTRRTVGSAVAWSDGLDAAIDAMCDPAPRDRGLSTGIGCLDDVIGGLKPGQLIVIGGRPGVGKSVLSIDIARAAAFWHNKPTLIRSLEMSTTEVRMRLCAAECDINLYRLANGPLFDDERQRLRTSAERLRNAPLFIDDDSTADLASIRSGARRIQQQHGLSLLVVDYLQLMTSTTTNEGRAQEVAAISRGLKLLARELGVPVIAAAQLNRQSETRTDKRPQLSDLRESGSIEADADVVILLHRPDLHDQEHPRAGEVDLIVCKNRNGPLDTATAAAQLQFARIVDMKVG